MSRGGVHIVQITGNSQTGGVGGYGFPTAPTAGNWLIAFGDHFNNLFPPGTTNGAGGWIDLENTNAGAFGTAIAYRLVPSSDGTSGTVWGSIQGSIVVMEVAGIAGTAFTDGIEGHFQGQDLGGTGGTTTPSNTASANGESMVVYIAGGADWTPTTGDNLFQLPVAAPAAPRSQLILQDDVLSIGDNPTWTATQASSVNWVYMGILFLPGTISPATDAEGEGDIGTVTISPISGGAAVNAEGEGGIGTIDLTAPTGVGQIITEEADISHFAMEVFASRSTEEARVSFYALEVLGLPPAVSALVSHYSLEVAAKPLTQISDISHMALLVLASGGEAPLKAGPITLRDYGRDQTLYQRLVNMYVEVTPQGPANNARYQRPGLYEAGFRDPGASREGGRGILKHQGEEVIVSGSNVWRGSKNVGTLPAGPVQLAQSTDQVVAIAGGKAWLLGVNAVTRIEDTDMPDNLIDVAYLAGRFLYMSASTNQWAWSDLGDATSIDGLSFANADSSADFNIGFGVVSDNVAIFGTDSVEWWYVTADPDAPYQRSIGRTYGKGCAARRTIRLVDNSLMYVGSDRIIYRTGAEPERISDHSVEDKLRRVTATDLPNCDAFAAYYGGHTFYVVTMPGQGTWALDVESKTWAEWKSWGKDQFRVSCADGEIYLDRLSGSVLGFDGKTFTDLGDPIERVCSSFAPLKSGSIMNFNLALHCTRGVGLDGNDYGSEPVCEMRWSDELGSTWTDWLEAPLGVIGDHSENVKAIWTQLGKMDSPGRLYEFRCTDPVFWAPFRLDFNEERP